MGGRGVDRFIRGFDMPAGEEPSAESPVVDYHNSPGIRRHNQAGADDVPGVNCSRENGWGEHLSSMGISSSDFSA